jgi:hypothetical protein
MVLILLSIRSGRASVSYKVTVVLKRGGVLPPPPWSANQLHTVNNSGNTEENTGGTKKLTMMIYCKKKVIKYFPIRNPRHSLHLQRHFIAD